VAEIQLHHFDGGQETIQVEDRLVGEPLNQDLLFRAVQRELTNRRQGNAATKTRAEVKGTGRKPWRQKGTGRARAGSFKSPLWRGGGVIFGPQPRDYNHDMPRKMRRKAMRVALSDKFRNGQLSLLDRLAFEEPKTKEGRKLLERLEQTDKTLVICALSENNMAVRKSFTNLPNATLLPTPLITVYNMLGHDNILMTQAAMDELAERI
jgi:large subunit ribosomal protein L4